MRIQIIEEHGYDAALKGLALSYNQNPNKMEKVAMKLCFKGNGHNKFLESIILWLDITAPRYFWQQIDTYRHSTKQSESTMHTITARVLQQSDFEHPVPSSHLEYLNRLIITGDWERVKHNLPESFLQRRIVCMSYMTLQRIIVQRANHRLAEWKEFIQEVGAQSEHPELLFQFDKMGTDSLVLTGLLCQKM